MIHNLFVSHFFSRLVALGISLFMILNQVVVISRFQKSQTFYLTRNLKNMCWQMEKWRFWCMLDMCHRSLACWKRRCMIRKQFWHTELLAENRLIYVHRYRDGSAWSCAWKLDFGFYKFHHEELLAWFFGKIRFLWCLKIQFQVPNLSLSVQDLVYLAAFSYKGVYIIPIYLFPLLPSLLPNKKYFNVWKTISLA